MKEDRRSAGTTMSLIFAGVQLEYYAEPRIRNTNRFVVAVAVISRTLI
jgi:hypothetical protein